MNEMIKTILLVPLIYIIMALAITQQAQASSALVKQACKLLKEAIDRSNLKLEDFKANGTEVPQSYLDKRTNAIEHYNRDCFAMSLSRVKTI